MVNIPCMEDMGYTNREEVLPDAKPPFVDSCMLVSDSNETSTQLDSKKLEYDELVALAQDNLFKKYLDMSKYLTRNQFETYRPMLKSRYDSLNRLHGDLKDPSRIQPLFRPVHGQVILVEVDALNEVNLARRQAR